MHAPAKPAYPVLEAAKLTDFDGFIFGFPTRFGTMPAQWRVSGCAHYFREQQVLTRRRRLSGTRPAHSGRAVLSQGSTRLLSCPRPLPVEGKVILTR